MEMKLENCFRISKIENVVSKPAFKLLAKFFTSASLLQKSLEHSWQRTFEYLFDIPGWVVCRQLPFAVQVLIKISLLPFLAKT